MSDRSLYTSRDKSRILQVREHTHTHTHSSCCEWWHYKVKLTFSSLTHTHTYGWWHYEVILVLSGGLLLHEMHINSASVDIIFNILLRSCLLCREISLADSDLIDDPHTHAYSCDALFRHSHWNWCVCVMVCLQWV